MKNASFLCLLLMLAFLTGCQRDTIQIPEQVLQGQIGGNEWIFKSGNAFIFSSDGKYQLKFLSTQEPGNDPCGIPAPGRPFISMILPLRIGSFSLPLPVIQESVRFHITAANSQIATSGFLEIFDINNAQIIGYMQAQLDDENIVEGSFEVLVCNN